MTQLTSKPWLGDLTANIVEVEGSEKPPVLMIHGLMGGAWNFEKFQSHFALHGFGSVAINLRGHFDSKPVSDIGQISLRDYFEDAAAAARKLGNPIVIGHSMGGLIAQKLAEAGLARAAVLLCSAPPRGINPTSLSLLPRQVKHLPNLALSRPIVADRSDANAVMFNNIPESERETLFARLTPDSGRVGREMTLGLIAVDERQVRCPIVSISGGRDRFLVARIGGQLAQKYNCELKHFERMGHFLVWEPGWEDVATYCVEWMKSKS